MDRERERERERERVMFLSTRVVAINKQIVKLKHNFTCSKKKKNQKKVGCGDVCL